MSLACTRFEKIDKKQTFYKKNTKVFIASKMTTTAKQIVQKSGRKRRKTTTEKHNICIDLQAFLQACFQAFLQEKVIPLDPKLQKLAKKTKKERKGKKRKKEKRKEGQTHKDSVFL